MINTSNIQPFKPNLPLQTERGVFNYMSTPTIYGLIRQLVEETKGPYLEIGSYRGQSLLTAGKDNDFTCIGIDNFTGTGHREENESILKEQIAPYGNISLIKADYHEGFKQVKKKRKKFGVIFLDGPHGKKETVEQLEYAAKLIKKGGYIIIDDLNKTEVAFALDQFLQTTAGKKYKIVLDQTTKDRNDKVWWNGIAVIQKG